MGLKDPSIPVPGLFENGMWDQTRIHSTSVAGSGLCKGLGSSAM